MIDRFYKLPVHIAERKDLTAAMKLIVAVLLDRVGDNGHCWPGLKTICNDTGLSRSTVIRGIETLEKKGLVMVDRPAGLSNRYHFDTGIKLTPVSECDGGECQNDTRGSIKMTPEPDQLNQTQ